jgi:hypothetical protein
MEVMLNHKPVPFALSDAYQVTAKQNGQPAAGRRPGCTLLQHAAKAGNRLIHLLRGRLICIRP